MSGLSCLSKLILAGVLALSPLACSDSENGGDGDADTGPATLSDQLTAAGLPPGNYRVESGGNAVCIRTRTYPGGNPVSEAIDLSGFTNFELVVSSDDSAALRGTYDQLATRWLESECLEWDASTDELTNHRPCGSTEDPCTPFSLVRLCAGGGSPTFFASVPNCGHNTFPATPQ